MKKEVLITICTVMILSGISLVPNVFSQDIDIPEWVKNNAGWWANDQLDDTSFVSSIQWLISNDVMIIPYTEQGSENSNNIIPNWVKNTAGWWANGEISEKEFVNGIQFLIRNDVIMISNSSNDDRLCENYQLSAKFKENIQGDVKEQWDFLCSNFYDEKYLGWSPLGDMTCSEYTYATFCFNVKTSTTLTDPAVNLNNLGFRCTSDLCPEMSKEKPMNTYRIFLVGGSSMFGIGSASDIETIPGHLQKMFNKKNHGFDIEVINAGISSAWSKNEVKLIENKLTDLNPDLILVYDGFNDITASAVRPGYTEGSEIEWKDRWSEICSLGKKNGFETVVTLQAFNGSGFRSLTENDIEIFAQEGFLNREIVKLYREQIPELDQYCTSAIDMTRIFDHIHEGDLYIDGIHSSGRANEIIANEFYQISVPIINGKKYSEPVNSNMNYKKDVVELLSIENLDFSKVNFENMDLSGIDFSGRNFENAVFYNSKLDNANFENANIKGGHFGGASLNNVNFKGANLEGAKLIKTTINGADFTDSILDRTQLFEIDFTNVIISNASINNAKVLVTNFKGMDLSGIDLSGTLFTKTATIMTGLEMKKMEDLKNGIIFSETSVGVANKLAKYDYGFNTEEGYFKYYPNRDVISNANLVNTNLSGTNLSGLNLVGIDFTGADLSGAILRGVDLSGKDLSGTILTGADLASADLEGVDLSGKDLSGTILRGVDLSGKDLSGTILTGADLTSVDLEGVDLSGKDLSGTILRDVDLSGKDLSGTILTGADLASADLEGVDLSGKDLSGTILSRYDPIQYNTINRNFLSNCCTNLSEVNFTGVDLRGVNLKGVQLHNVDLSGKDLSGTILTGADLSGAILRGVDLSEKNLTSTTFTGADLSGSNLNGVDFTASDLTDVNLTDASLIDTNLTKVKLTGADLTNAEIKDAIMVSTVLTGANLTNTTITETEMFNVILGCVNHPICN